MIENLKTAKYNDGSSVPLVTDNAFWEILTTPAYCWYNNDLVTYKNIFGALYNRYEVNTNKLCPNGWHVPTDNKWTILTNYQGGEDIAGGKLKETGTKHWNSPNTGATNETGFTALPSGERGYYGPFYSIGVDCNWWSSTEEVTGYAWCRIIWYDYSVMGRSNAGETDGHSVRCLKN